jgi:tetratricopeptide (TPR) repeat protein
MFDAIESARMSIRMAIRTIAAVVAFAACVAAVGITLPWLQQRPELMAGDAEPVYLPKAEYLKLMSLGYDNVLADILWFRTINYFGKHYRSDRTYPWLAHMCDVVTDLDPRAEHVYRFAGMILPWEAGQAEAGIRLLEKGVRQFPDSWLMYYWIGFNYYYFEDDLGKAAEYLRRAAHLPGAHPNAARLAALLAAEHYGPETTLHFLAELKNEVDSKEMREVVDENIRQAQLTRDLERLNGAVRQYQARTGRSPDTLVALVDAQLLERLPSEPFGGVYQIDADTGEVKSSSGHTPSKLYRSSLREKHVRQAGRDS